MHMIGSKQLKASWRLPIVKDVTKSFMLPISCKARQRTSGLLTSLLMRTPRRSHGRSFAAAFVLIMFQKGEIKVKRKEFQELKQGSMTVHEYLTKFM
jgi:hypothetical protein